MKNFFKALIVLSLISVLVITFVSCSKKTEGNKSSGQKDGNDATNVTTSEIIYTTPGQDVEIDMSEDEEVSQKGSKVSNPGINPSKKVSSKSTSSGKNSSTASKNEDTTPSSPAASVPKYTSDYYITKD